MLALASPARHAEKTQARAHAIAPIDTRRVRTPSRRHSNLRFVMYGSVDQRSAIGARSDMRGKFDHVTEPIADKYKSLASDKAPSGKLAAVEPHHQQASHQRGGLTPLTNAGCARLRLETHGVIPPGRCEAFVRIPAFSACLCSLCLRRLTNMYGSQSFNLTRTRRPRIPSASAGGT